MRQQITGTDPLQGFRWRHMTNADLPGVHAVAEAVHTTLPERPEIFAERLTLFSQGCRVLASDAHGIMGYAISHPIRPFEPPKLDAMLGEIGADATQFYIHDVAVDQRLRGYGFANLIIEQLLVQATAYTSVGLVSVYGTAVFWERFGFKPTLKDMRRKLAAYGDGAVFMTHDF